MLGLVIVCSLVLVWYQFQGAKNQGSIFPTVNTGDGLSNQEYDTSSGDNGGVSPNQPLSESAYPDDLWVIFSQYIERAKQHDLAGLSGYSFYLSDVCKDPKQKNECFAKMDALVEAARPLVQKDFVNEWKDNKQAIFSTNFIPHNGGIDLGYARSIIVFGKDKDNRYKILSLNPQQLWQIKRNAASSTEEVEKKLSLMIKDTDQDGVTDEFENCIFPENLLVMSCTKSDPKKRDTNGDGWWDGVEMYIQK